VPPPGAAPWIGYGKTITRDQRRKIRTYTAAATIQRMKTGVSLRTQVGPTFPIADRFMRASCLKREVLGHLLKDYAETHIESELKQAAAMHALKQARHAQQPAWTPFIHEEEYTWTRTAEKY
jgi:hypothetical protein